MDELDELSGFDVTTQLFISFIPLLKFIRTCMCYRNSPDIIKCITELEWKMYCNWTDLISVSLYIKLCKDLAGDIFSEDESAAVNSFLFLQMGQRWFTRKDNFTFYITTLHWWLKRDLHSSLCIVYTEYMIMIVSLTELSLCLNANHEVAGSIPGTSTLLKVC